MNHSCLTVTLFCPMNDHGHTDIWRRSKFWNSIYNSYKHKDRVIESFITPACFGITLSPSGFKIKQITFVMFIHTACGAGEEWKISAGQFMWEMKKYYLGSRSRGNCLLQQVIEGRVRGGGQKWQEDEEEDVGSYWMTLRKREDTLIWRRKHYVESLLWKRLWTYCKTDY